MHIKILSKNGARRAVLSSLFIGIFLISALSSIQVTRAAYPPIPVGNAPFGVAFASSNNDIYVANEGDANISVISTSTNTVVSTIAVGSFPFGVAFASSNNDIYVTNYGSHSVSVINASTNTVVSTIAVGINPAGVAFASSNGDIYVVNYFAGTVSVISTSNNTVVGLPIPVGSYPWGVAFAPSNGDIYVTNSVDGTVSVISTSTNTVVGSPILVGNGPLGVAFSPSNNDIYVANSGDGTVSVIDTSSNTVVGSPITVGTWPYGAAFASSNGDMYVTNHYDGTVSVINTSTNTVVGSPLTVGKAPWEVAFAPSNNGIYVANEGSNTVSFIPLLGVSVSPSSATLDVGQPQLFTATASGGSGSYSSSTGYQWYVGGVSQSGQTASTFSYSPGSAGSYSITATVTDSSSTTSPQCTAATVTVHASPTVSIAPAGPFTMDVGQGQAFTATPNGGSGSLTYQWYLDSSAVGTNSAGYSYTAAAGSHSVTCTVTDSASTPVTSPVSNAVSITVNSALAATVISVDKAAVDQGQTAHFSISTAASGGTTPFTYLWLQKAPAGSFVSTGVTSQAFSFAPDVSAAVGTWSFELQVTDSAGTPVVVTSNVIAITVAASPTVSIAPVGPLALTVGQVQAFTATPSGGSGTLSYQWYLDGVAVGSNSASYSYTAAGTSHTVTCQVTDSASTPVTSPASNVVSVTVSSAIPESPELLLGIALVFSTIIALSGLSSKRRKS